MSVREYKSNVFAMLLEVPNYALEVYNALNGSSYEDVSLLEIKKLNSGIILSMRNDASFLLDSYMNLYEHQSTSNPNMPLRFLLYFSSILQDMVAQKEYDLYGKKQIPIPTPKFVVFYNGVEARPEKETMRLSDAFLQKNEHYQLELMCEVYNINPGNNIDVMKNSHVLSGYTDFVEKVREKMVENKDIKEAVSEAIDECIKEGILKDFFQKNRKEVEEVAALDFTFERREELIRRDSFEEGKEEGREEGKLEGKTEGKLEERKQGICAALEMLLNFLDEEQAILQVADKYQMSAEDVRNVWEEKE